MIVMDDLKKVLVLGSNGLVGDALKMSQSGMKDPNPFVAFYPQNKLMINFSNRGDLDLTDFDAVDKYLQKNEYDWVVNCAGTVGGVKANMERGMDFFKDNMIINMNVIEACLKNKVPNVISFLSTCIFPDEIAKGRKLVENDLHYGKPHSSNYPYAYSKRMIEVLSNMARDKGFNYCCLIPTNVYGLNDNYNLNDSHLIPALIHKGYLAKESGDKLKVWGSGKPLREFIYSKDVARIVFEIIEGDMKFDNLIISSQQSYSIKEISQLIADSYQLKGIEFLSDYPDGQLKKETDTSKFKSLFPDFKFTEMEVGLSEVTEYFKKNFEENMWRLRL